MAGEARLERRGALDHLAEALAESCGNALRIEVMPSCGVLNLRGAPEPAFLADVERAVGAGLPVEANRWAGNDRLAALWLGPDEWLLVAQDGDAGEIERRVRDARPDDPLLSVTDVSDVYTPVALSGSGSRELLSQGCALDLHPDAFSAGDCAQTILAKCQVLLRGVDADSFEVWVRNSFANYLATWLLGAASPRG